MSHSTFNTANGLGMPSGLASRRGGQNLKPLSFDAIKASTEVKDNGAPTPRTSRSHLLAGLEDRSQVGDRRDFSQPSDLSHHLGPSQREQELDGPGHVG